MEALMPTPVTSLDVERFLYSPPEDSASSGSEDLPIIGTSALEQILCPSSPSSISSHSSSTSSGSSLSSMHDMERMSPDSTMEFSRSQSGDAFQSANGYHLSQNSPPIIQQPDSTTADLNNYDSDDFNSDDSCDSSFEIQQNDRIPSNASDSRQANTFNQHQNQYRSNPIHLPQPSVRSNLQQHHPTPSPQNLDLIYNSSTYNGVHQDQKNNINNNNNNNVPLKKKKKKKSKRAGDVILTCNLCDYTTRYKEHLTSHMHTHDPSRNYMCSDCGQTFKWSHSLKRHQNSAHKMDPDHRYTCKFCMKTFSRKDHLSIHENLHTSSGVTYPCTECGATFKNKKTLTGHIKTHTSQKAFKCGQCDSEFTRRASLNRHVKAAHEGQTIKCPDCTLVFSYRSTLEDHKKAAHNEGKREFECELCGQDFAVKAYLSKHMVTCRNRRVGKTYSCHLCTKKGFLSKLRLSEHEKRKHPAVVVTSVVNGGDTSIASPTSSSHNQSEVNLQTTETQSNSTTHQLITPMSVRPSSNTSSSESSSNVSAYPTTNMNPSILPNLPSSVPSTQKQWENNSYFNHPGSINQHPLMTSSYPMVQHQQHEQQGYVSSQHFNSCYPPYGIHATIPTTATQTHIQSAGSFPQPLASSPTISNQQNFTNNGTLPTMSADNASTMPHQGEENVGSLLRLVYSCSDNNMEPNYNINTPNFASQEGHSNAPFMEHQTHSSKPNIQQHHHHISNPQTINLNNACVMPDYTSLDHELSRGVCFDWDSFAKIDCKN